MQKFYYLATATMLIIGGLGIYSSQAGNNMLPNQNNEMYIETISYTASPENKSPKQQNQDRVKPTGGFVPLPEDKGVEVAPINPEPNLEENPSVISVDETVTETVN